MRVIDKELLKEFASVSRCELCGKYPRDCDPHHAVYTRGHCRLDIRPNLLSVCRKCHTEIQEAGKTGRDRCIAVIAKREGCTPEDVEAVCRFFRNLKKGQRVWNQSSDHLSGKACAMVFAVAASAPDQSPKPRPLKKKRKETP